MGNPYWEDIAIPEGYGPERLLYNPPTETVIAELRSIGDEFGPNKICIRQKDSLKYEPVNDFERMVSSESAVTPLDRPLLFYVSRRLTKTNLNLGSDLEAMDGFTGYWEGLYSFELERRENRKIADKNSLLLPAPYTKGWIAGLVDASADASELYLTLGMMVTESGVSYQLARMSLPEGKLHLISELRGAFF